MLGFEFLENFDYPYISRTVTEFWRRWHISLSTWFREYVYIPLGGNRKGQLFTVRNMLAVWFLTGLWHGASWNYILWGLYYFVFLVLERFVLKKILARLPVINHVYTLIVVFFGWVIFKFESLPQLGSVLVGLFAADGRKQWDLTASYGFQNNMFLLAFCVIAVTPLGKKLRDFVYAHVEEGSAGAAVMNVLDAVLPVILLFLSMFALVGNSYNPFLYFQF